MDCGPLIVVLHDVSSAQRLLDALRVAYAMGVKVFVASKVYGAAATSGVGDAMRIALRSSRSFFVLPALKDAIELLSPDAILVFSREYGEPLDLDEMKTLAKGKTMLVFGGSEGSPGKDAAALGRPVYFKGVEEKLAPAAEMALALYALRECREETSIAPSTS